MTPGLFPASCDFRDCPNTTELCVPCRYPSGQHDRRREFQLRGGLVGQWCRQRPSLETQTSLHSQKTIERLSGYLCQMGIPHLGDKCRFLSRLPARSVYIQLPLQDRTSAVIRGIAVASRQHHSQGVTASVFRAVSAKTTVVLLLVLATKTATKTTAFKPDAAALVNNWRAMS